MQNIVLLSPEGSCRKEKENRIFFKVPNTKSPISYYISLIRLKINKYKIIHRKF